MIKVAFSAGVDEARLTHMRKEIIGVMVWDKYLERGRLEWATWGDEEATLDVLLKDIKRANQLSNEMIENGRFVFGFKSLQNPERMKVVIEKYEVRRSIFGKVYGYRAELSAPDLKVKPAYFVSKSLPDLNTKLFAIIVQGQEALSLDEAGATTALATL